jgi:hypothetical protein
MSRARISAAVRRAGLKTSFSRSYNPAPLDTAISQAPTPGKRVQDGTLVRVLLSAGPAPVPVPQLIGLSAAAARAQLSGRGLRASITEVPAPLASTGTVTRAAPPAGTKLLPGSSVSLSVAQAPRWRPLTSFTGHSSGSSAPFRIRGRSWQVVYSMAYRGTCTFVLFCSGPSAIVKRVSDGSTIDSFSLGDGTAKTHEFKTAPGVYEISVSAGSDTAQWSIDVQDRY